MINPDRDPTYAQIARPLIYNGEVSGMLTPTVGAKKGAYVGANLE